MNKILLINTTYLRPNHTIETLQLPNGQAYYLYNHQGNTTSLPAAVRLFNQKKELNNYLNALPYQMVGEFYSEAALDVFFDDLRLHDVRRRTKTWWLLGFVMRISNTKPGISNKETVSYKSTPQY